jgi:hypothetical protein
MEFEERRQFRDAGLTLTPPEVEQDNLAPVIGQMDGGQSVGDVKVRGCMTGLRGMRAAVACGHQGQRKKQRE